MENVIKRGLVMEGGAMRGLFTCGVIDSMLEAGINYDGAVGVSAGVAFGCNFKSNQIGRALRYNKQYIGDKRYASFSNLIKEGNYFSADFCYGELPRKLDVFDTEAFEKNPMEFYAVATNAQTGKPAYCKLSDGGDRDLLWIRASASIPMLSKPVVVDGYELLDGGITDSIPIRFMEKLGYNKNVVVLTRPFGYTKKKEYTGVAHILLRNYPNMIKAMENRPQMYNSTLDYIRQKELSGQLFVIRPPKSLEMPNMTKNPDDLQRMYDAGREVMQKKLDDLKRYLG